LTLLWYRTQPAGATSVGDGLAVDAAVADGVLVATAVDDEDVGVVAHPATASTANAAGAKLRTPVRDTSIICTDSEGNGGRVSRVMPSRMLREASPWCSGTFGLGDVARKISVRIVAGTEARGQV
jgi:hypothetical protein